jgi:hypothetical protein
MVLPRVESTPPVYARPRIIPEETAIFEIRSDKIIGQTPLPKPAAPLDEKVGREIESQFSRMVQAAGDTLHKKSVTAPKPLSKETAPVPKKEPEMQNLSGETVFIPRQAIQAAREIPDEFEITTMPDDADQVTRVLLMEQKPAALAAAAPPKPPAKPAEKKPAQTQEPKKGAQGNSLDITGEDIMSKIDSFFGING